MPELAISLSRAHQQRVEVVERFTREHVSIIIFLAPVLLMESLCSAICYPFFKIVMSLVIVVSTLICTVMYCKAVVICFIVSSDIVLSV